MDGELEVTADGRSRLLAAGVELVVERMDIAGGALRGLTPAEVADRAGLARSSLYRYWPVGPDGSSGKAAGFQAYLVDLAGVLSQRPLDTGELALRTLAASDELVEVLAALSGAALGSGSERWWASVLGVAGTGGDWSAAAEALAAVLELVLTRSGYELRDGGTWDELAISWLAVCDGAALWDKVAGGDVVVRMLDALVAHWCRPAGDAGA